MTLIFWQKMPNFLLLKVRKNEQIILITFWALKKRERWWFHLPQLFYALKTSHDILHESFMIKCATYCHVDLWPPTTIQVCTSLCLFENRYVSIDWMLIPSSGIHYEQAMHPLTLETFFVKSWAKILWILMMTWCSSS